MEVLYDSGAFISKRRPEETVRPEYFYAGFDELWTGMESSDRSKNMRYV